MATDTNISIYDIDTPSYCQVVDTNTGKAIVGFASFAEAEEIAKKYNLSIHSYTKRDGERVWTDCGWEDAPFDMRRAFIEVDRLSLYEKSEAEGLREDVVSFRFANINAWGIKEYYVAALHYCATMPKIEDQADKEMLVEHVLKPAAKFFCADNDDMDNEIINEELAKWN